MSKPRAGVKKLCSDRFIVDVVMQTQSTSKGGFEMMLLVLLERQLVASHQKLFPVPVSPFAGFG